MVNIFGNFVEDIVEVLFNNLISYGTTFDQCLYNLTKVLQRCIEAKLMLNWELCHFMVREEIVFGRRVSAKGIAIDESKIEAIQKLP